MLVYVTLVYCWYNACIMLVYCWYNDGIMLVASWYNAGIVNAGCTAGMINVGTLVRSGYTAEAIFLLPR